MRKFSFLTTIGPVVEYQLKNKCVCRSRYGSLGTVSPALLEPFPVVITERGLSRAAYLSQPRAHFRDWEIIRQTNPEIIRMGLGFRV